MCCYVLVCLWKNQFSEIIFRLNHMYICIYIWNKVLKYKKNCLQLDIALWCKNQIEHSIWDESLLFSNCACSLEYSTLSTPAGLSYHICGKLEVAFIGSPSSQHQHQHCTDEAQKAETVSALVTFRFCYFQLCQVALLSVPAEPCGPVSRRSV